LATSFLLAIIRPEETIAKQLPTTDRAETKMALENVAGRKLEPMLMKDRIRQPDLSQSVQGYQLAVEQAMVRLNLAVYRGAWLMPARMVINMKA